MFNNRAKNLSSDWSKDCLELTILTKIQYHSSATQGDLKYVSAYVAQNADDPVALNARDENGETALHRAVRHQQPDVAKYLLQVPHIYKNARNNQGCTPFMLAILIYPHTCVEVLLADKEIDVGLPANSDDSPLTKAIYMNSNHVQAILNHPSLDIKEQQRYIEKQRQSGDFFRNLVKPGTEIDSMIQATLTKAKKKPVTKSILFCAAAGGDLKTLKRYLEENTNDPDAINVTDTSNQDTPLHAAVRRWSSAFVRALLNYSHIDVLRKNKDGLTALELARQVQSVECVNEIESYLARNNNKNRC